MTPGGGPYCGNQADPRPTRIHCGALRGPFKSPLGFARGFGKTEQAAEAPLFHGGADVLQFGHLVRISKLPKDSRQSVVEGIGIPRLRNLIRCAYEIAPLGMTFIYGVRLAVVQ